MRGLLTLLDANRGRGSPLRAEDAAETAVVYVYDAIGLWGVEAGPFVQAVRALKAPKMSLRINSPGGDVFDARAMKAALDDYAGTITAHVDGIAASAASFLMMAADEVVMGDGAFVMIHNAWGLTIGNAEDHRMQAGILDKVDDGIVADYARKTGKPADELRALMAAETWFTAQEAVDAGLADRVAETKAARAASRWNLSAYARAPEIAAPDFARERSRYDARLRLFERTA